MFINLSFITIAASILSSTLIFCQEEHPQFTDAIEDNSFFVEEAFNQEEHVVQHISNATYFSHPEHDIVFTFTQEWPLFSQQHQFSFTVPYVSLNSGASSGVGDILLNYRYQLMTNNQFAAFAPRLSIILPTGHSNAGLGDGVVGAQINLPLSKRLSNLFIMHINAGMTVLPNVSAVDATGIEIRRTISAYSLSASIIMLAGPNYNFMMETVQNFLSEIDSNGEIARNIESIISPGIRCAININDLQIVPGIGMPILLSRDNTRFGVFMYLSFEHPF